MITNVGMLATHGGGDAADATQGDVADGGDAADAAQGDVVGGGGADEAPYPHGGGGGYDAAPSPELTDEPSAGAERQTQRQSHKMLGAAQDSTMGSQAGTCTDIISPPLWCDYCACPLREEQERAHCFKCNVLLHPSCVFQHYGHVYPAVIFSTTSAVAFATGQTCLGPLAGRT